MLKQYSKCLQRPVSVYAQVSRLAACRGRTLLTLAIETSCDDTSVAILETHPTPNPLPDHARAHLHFHQKITANNSAHHGIHPIVALGSHQQNLAPLIENAILTIPNRKPDFITVTRGPGMRSALATGLDTAKGLSLAWRIPILAVNHMQAHALTPRLVSALQPPPASPSPSPTFPFLTLLISGGHTLLVHSLTPTHHAILASTSDTAVGSAIDKMARVILPPDILAKAGDIMYGRELERFAFPHGTADFNYYTPPATRAEEIERRRTEWEWSLAVPLADARGGLRRGMGEFSFSGLESSVRRICAAAEMGMGLGLGMGVEERRGLARECMRVAFEHLAIRLYWALRELRRRQQQQQHHHIEEGREIKTVVVSGGVASNEFLRHVLRSVLDARGFEEVELCCPPGELCTDNAAMIAWTGVEMWREGWESELSVRAMRKWSIDPGAEDGGILGVEGWKRREGLVDENHEVTVMV